MKRVINIIMCICIAIFSLFNNSISAYAVYGDVYTIQGELGTHQQEFHFSQMAGQYTTFCLEEFSYSFPFTLPTQQYLKVGRQYRITFHSLSYNENYSLTRQLGSLTLANWVSGWQIESPDFSPITSLPATVEFTCTSSQNYKIATNMFISASGNAPSTGGVWAVSGISYFQPVVNITIEDITPRTEREILEDIDGSVNVIEDTMVQTNNDISNTSNSMSSEATTAIDSYQNAEDAVTGEAMSNLNSMDFDSGSFDSYNKSGKGSWHFLAFVWIGDLLQQLFNLTDFSALFAVTSILSFVVVAIGLRRFWNSSGD